MAVTSINWHNQTIWTADNLPIMRGMNSNSVDLIYLDPPFNSKANYAAPIGSKAAGAEFKDTWTLQDVDIAWLDLIEAKHSALNKVIHAAMNSSDKSYLIYMSVRLLEMKRVLKPTGSIYLHCDPTMSHYLKLVMDAVFGRRNFRNEIVWCYTGPANTKKRFPRKHDIILFYSQSDNSPFYRDSVRIPYGEETLARRSRVEGEKSIISASVDNSNKRTLEEVKDRFGDGKVPEDWWRDIGILTNQRERIGYPTQKPLSLLRRIISASSVADNVIMDPFCGCATACIAAEELGRQWVGIDISSKAAELVDMRMNKDLGLFYKGINRTDIPQRTDIAKLKRYNHLDNRKYLYGEQGGYCNGCNEHFQLQNLTVDHIIPKSKGGTDHLENLQLLCGHCNSVKGDRGHEYLIARLAN